MTMDTHNSIKDFSLEFSSTAVNAISVREHLTLRNACVEYRDANGSCWVDSDMPEASAAQSSEQIPCLNRFRNIIGHMENSEMICFKLHKANSLLDMISILGEKLNVAITSGRLWALPGTTKYKFSGNIDNQWSEMTGIVPKHHYEILNKVRYSLGSPLSASITHAAMETDHYRTEVSYNKIFLYPHNAAISIGLIGSLHDNQCIDMSPGEESKVANMDNRSYKIDEYIGFICAGHTSHSAEAGRVRRVACSVKVRILSEDTLMQLEAIINDISSRDHKAESHLSEKWTVFCMGIYCDITYAELVLLCYHHRLISLIDPPTFSIHICKDLKFANLSITSGTLIKQCSNGYWADNIEVYKSSRIKSSINPKIDTKGTDQMRACFSAYFNLIPYINENRAPRPLIASVQTPQAVCLPWCPGNAAVSPCYTFNPVVTTSFYSSIMQDMKTNECNISAYLPGENVQCLFLNLENTYEDAIMVSKKYVQNGGFSTMSLCSYNISRNECILPVGSTMCGILCEWWKSPCQQGCTHDRDTLIRGQKYIVGYSPTGVVHSITELNNGDVNVRIRSHQQLQDGDKLSMGHGQKGIAVLTEYENMPIAYHPVHGQIIPDIVMGMSSVVTRQTNGLIYEAVKSLTLFAKSAPLPYIAKYGDRPCIDDEFTVMSGKTGIMFRTLVYNTYGNIRLDITKATLGIIRVFNQTQMSRERHQISHIKASKYSLRTSDGRARGGGVSWGEMEVMSTSSAGLHCCDDEIAERGDRIMGKYCTVCQRLGLLCTCTTEDNHVLVKAPYDLIISDCINAVVFDGSFQYKFSPEL